MLLVVCRWWSAAESNDWQSPEDDDDWRETEKEVEETEKGNRKRGWIPDSWPPSIQETHR